MCSTAPRWLGVAAAILFWVRDLIFAGRMATKNITSGFQSLIKLVFAPEFPGMPASGRRWRVTR